MSTELAVVESGNTPATLADLEGMEGLGLENVRPKLTPINLIQRSSRVPGVMPGKLYDVLMEEAHDSLQVVPLHITPSRTLFPPGGELGKPPICHSQDGIKPDPWAMEPQSTYCRNCPRNDWSKYDRKSGTGQKAECQQISRLYVILRNTGYPRFFNIKSTSKAPLDMMLQRIEQYSEMERRVNGRKKNLFEYTFTIGSQPKDGKKGSYFVYTFSDLKRLANPAEFGPYFKEFILRAKSGDRLDDEIPKEVENVESELEKAPWEVESGDL